MHRGDFQPSWTRSPFTISCSTRARPRVESFSSRVAWYDGHITPRLPVLSARHLPTPEHLCTSAEKRSAGRPTSAASPQIGVDRPRIDQHSGIEQVVGVEGRLHLAEQGDRGGEYIAGNSADRARPSPCSPDIDPP